MVRRKIKMLGWILAGAVVVSGLTGTWLITARADRNVNTNLFGVAIKGYDTVAYFIEGRPMRGSSKYEVSWQDARWRFATAEHRDLFASNPDRYAPQYGGFCASYLAVGGIAGADPEAWVIIDDKLYLAWSKEGRDRWLEQEDPAADIEKADAEWIKRQGQG